MKREASQVRTPPIADCMYTVREGPIVMQTAVVTRTRTRTAGVAVGPGSSEPDNDIPRIASAPSDEGRVSDFTKPRTAAQRAPSGLRCRDHASAAMSPSPILDRIELLQSAPCTAHRAPRSGTVTD